MRTTHTPNLDNLDPIAREILGDTLRDLFRIHPIAPPFPPSDQDREIPEARRDEACK